MRTLYVVGLILGTLLVLGGVFSFYAPYSFCTGYLLVCGSVCGLEEEVER